ncbi:DUF4336 domain-containing protein [Prochlorococcus sp. MIT 1341]|uniref:DUF4336 domain-containing protein n=1 Tax=Prochlorococcus sp. MIT 1341 TaxID=3096221 RepID=UPI002A759C90|nr:DUF4336 domain-containing protein [Prochlorococcus sp. MIT 1341]
MEVSNITSKKDSLSKDISWPWWPLLPLYPYGRRKTLVKELIPESIWSFEQLQGLYYVAVPVRLTVVKVTGGLMLFNPLPPTEELRKNISVLEDSHGPVLTIVLPTASGLEHKISLPALSRAFPEAEIWICPGQWSFPVNYPLDWLGIPEKRAKILLKDGCPHEDLCSWISLGPLDIGLGRFQEVACFHKPSGSVLVTDALVGISKDPPEIFDIDPTPLIFHSRDRGDEPLLDSPEARKKGWARLVLFASFLRPALLDIPPVLDVMRFAFRPALLSPKSHFGVFPFSWRDGWENSANELLGENKPRLQIAPVLERLVFPRAKETIFNWLDELREIDGIKWLISSHYNAPLEFNSRVLDEFKTEVTMRTWASSEGNWSFLGSVDTALLKIGVVPNDPLKEFKDRDRLG